MSQNIDLLYMYQFGMFTVCNNLFEFDIYVIET